MPVTIRQGNLDISGAKAEIDAFTRKARVKFHNLGIRAHPRR